MAYEAARREALSKTSKDGPATPAVATTQESERGFWHRFLRSDGRGSLSNDDAATVANLKASMFAKFLTQGETIVHLGPVWKRRKLSCHLRVRAWP